MEYFTEPKAKGKGGNKKKKRRKKTHLDSQRQHSWGKNLGRGGRGDKRGLPHRLWKKNRGEFGRGDHVSYGLKPVKKGKTAGTLV